MAGHLSLRLFCLLLASVLSEPVPGRIPKVYNALITSNQNLEPSKAYPVYQPVIHDAAFGFPFHPAVFYGADYPLTNSLLPPHAAKPKDSGPTQSPAPADSPTDDKTPDQPEEAPPAQAPTDDGDDKKATPAPPLPPNTQSPIPLNQFGLPPQVLPLGRFDPAFDGFTQVGPFTYSYPNFRFYDPYDPFSLSPYGNLPPLYRPYTNVLSQSPPVAPPKGLEPPTSVLQNEQGSSGSTPPPEPSDLNVLNYASKDPAIPNVPPPPLPSSSAIQSDKSE